MVVRLCHAVPWVCLRFVIVVFPDHTHLLFLQREHMTQNTHVQSLHICKNKVTHVRKWGYVYTGFNI